MARPAQPGFEETSAGVVPSANRGGEPPTRTQRVASHLGRDWKVIAGVAASCGVVAAFSIWLWRGGHPVLAVLLAVVILPVTLAALFVRRAPCPRCTKPITIIGIEQCEHCREYIRIEGQTLKVVEVGYIAENLPFELNIPLGLIPRIVFPDDRCCVCGDLPAVSEVHEVQDTRVVVAHCGEHPDGMGWSLGLVSEAVPTVTLKFRSFDYWRAVRQANWAHVRAGMWR